MNELEANNTLNFDVKAFIFRLISYWKWFLLVLIIALYIVYHQNIRREFPYTLSTKISVQDDKNPLFSSSNTNLVFNYGGISGKVQEVVLNLKSRKHHEKVVDSLDLYLTYLKQGRFYKTDIYGQNPFRFVEADSAQQLLNFPVKISFISNDEFNLEVDFGESTSVLTQNFISKKVESKPIESGKFTKRFKLNEDINLPFLQGKFVPRKKFSTNKDDLTMLI